MLHEGRGEGKMPLGGVMVEDHAVEVLGEPIGIVKAVPDDDRMTLRIQCELERFP